jgi:hypothetical protein
VPCSKPLAIACGQSAHSHPEWSKNWLPGNGKQRCLGSRIAEWKRNPANPPVRVHWGEQTTDEMALVFLNQKTACRCHRHSTRTLGNPRINRRGRDGRRLQSVGRAPVSRKPQLAMPRLNSRASHALAKSQSRITVLSETCITSTVSATLSPPK